MTDCEDLEFAELDTHIRVQFAQAAEYHASAVDLDARLNAALKAGTSKGAGWDSSSGEMQSLSLPAHRSASSRRSGSNYSGLSAEQLSTSAPTTRSGARSVALGEMVDGCRTVDLVTAEGLSPMSISMTDANVGSTSPGIC